MGTQLHWSLTALALLLCQTNIGVESFQRERIVNGSTATAKQFPYQVLIDVHSNYNWQTAHCGGVIISERIILTAAHCFGGAVDAVRIYFGAVNKSNIAETGQQRLIVNRRNIIVHPEWDSSQLINDIALIKLPADLQFDEYIQPVQLPDPNETYANKEAVLSGWGSVYLKNNTGVLIKPDVLQYYRGNILSNANCSTILVHHHNYSIHFFPSSYICPDTTVSSPCSGDSGGPMVVEGADGTRTLVGLTSFGSPLCNLNIPNIYTRVSSFLVWIKKVGNL